MTTLPSFPKPARPFFSSGPCVKPPGWSTEALESAYTSRSHRSAECIIQLENLLTQFRSILEIPCDYYLGITPGSATGAMEMALWNLLGPCGITIWVWDYFSGLWAQDVITQLKLHHSQVVESAPHALLDMAYDHIFAWCGTTAGVALRAEQFSLNRQTNHQGLTFCDATSAMFTTHLPWHDLDVTAFSWQKGLGSEGAHGMLVLSPRALKRLENHTPPWPIPRLFQLKNASGKVDQLFFQGYTRNTPSMLCVKDCALGLQWIQSIGGLNGAIQRTKNNHQVLATWVAQSAFFVPLAPQSYQAMTPFCFQIAPAFLPSPALHWPLLQEMVKWLATAHVAFDILNHTQGHPALRIWCGPTVEEQDLQALLPWLTWAAEKVLKRKALLEHRS